jgi:hypothetical protein
MWIFIKGIPEEMDAKALERYVKRLLFPNWLPFGLHGRIKIYGSKILKIVHIHSHSVERHGLIQVLPASQVEWVMRQINQTRIGGRYLQSHPYSKRFTRLDTRDITFAGVQKASERRQVERRRSHLVSQVVDASM